MPAFVYIGIRQNNFRLIKICSTKCCILLIDRSILMTVYMGLGNIYDKWDDLTTGIKKILKKETCQIITAYNITEQLSSEWPMLRNGKRGIPSKQ